MAWQPGIGADIALLSSAAMDICIGHSPVKPLAASPLMGSAAQSNRRSNVRRNLMARIIVEPFYPCTRKFVARVGDRTQPSLEQLSTLQGHCSPMAVFAAVTALDFVGSNA